MLFVKRSDRGLFYFDKEKLNPIAEELNPDYVSALPFPHIVIDNFLPEDVLDEVLAEFPQPADIEWRKHYGSASKKLACNDPGVMGDHSRHLIEQLNSAALLGFLVKMTGIDDLIPDTLLAGPGGFHQTERGGFLGIHADFNFHPTWNLDRRINLILYLNKDWKEEYGGALELWNKEMTKCEKRILPIFNRCVVFSITDTAFHGHPDPLTCPDDVTRKSIAMFYYSNGRPEEEASEAHLTLYQTRNAKERLKMFLVDLAPPVMYRFYLKTKYKIFDN